MAGGRKRSLEDDAETPESSQSNRKVAREDLLSCQDRPWPLKSGMILEVQLRNFMCHETFTFKPGQRINFLVGENGSGKSAVLTAIIFGLGGSARTSNRGTSNKGFIRSGQASATVEITLCNLGDNQYKVDTYGEKLTIVRTVTQTTSNYKIKDHKGRVVVDKKVKEEVDNILTHFNIQVENPIVMLNQDASKSYLSNSKPTDLYKLFHKSTCLEEVEYSYFKAEKDQREAKLALERKQRMLPQLQKEKIHWEKQWEFHENLVNRKTDITDKESEYRWAVVRDAELNLDKYAKEKETLEKKIGLADKQVEAIKEKDKEVKASKKEIEANIQAHGSNTKEENDRTEILKKTYDDKRRIVLKTRREHTEVKRKMDNTADDIEKITRAIDEFKNGKYREFQEKAKSRGLEMARLNEEIGALTAQVETAGNHLQHLKSNKKDAEQSVISSKHELTSKMTKLSTLNQEVRELKTGQQTKLNAYGAWMPRLVSEIERCNKFDKKPIGPIGAHVVLKDNISSETAQVIEGELGNLLSSFCCNSNKDQRILYDMFKKHNMKMKPTIITTEFSSKKYDISKNRVNSKFTTLIDCVEVEDPTVYNVIIDSAKFEKLIIIPTALEAQAVLKNPATVPRNLKYAIAEGRHQYYPAPGYKSYYKDYRSRNILQSSIVEIIESKEAEMEQLKVVVEDFKVQLREMQANVSKAGQLLQEEEKKIKAVRERMVKKKTELQALKNEEFTEQPPDVAALEDDKERLTNELESWSNKLATKDAKLQEEQAEEEAAKKEVEAREKFMSERFEVIDPLNKKLGVIEENITKFKNDMVYYNVKKEEYKRGLDTVAKQYAAKEAEVQTKIDSAREVSKERVETRKKADALKREVAVLRANMEKLEENFEPKDVVRAKKEQFTKAYIEAIDEVKHFGTLINSLTTTIQERLKGYKYITRSTTKNVCINFAMQLNARHFIGDLNFNHEFKTLDIKVSPNTTNAQGGMNADRHLKSLSGGERSFTLISFVLALWNLMNPPFRILDEFDVFMDAANRQVSLQNIIKFARDDRKNQFLFLTPLGTDSIANSDDIMIIKLKKRAEGFLEDI